MSDVTPTQRRLLAHVVRDTDLQLRVAEALGMDLDGRPIDYTALLRAVGAGGGVPVSQPIPDEGRDITPAIALPREDEWYPNECQFCDRDAACACEDPVCRAAHLGEDGDFPGNGRDPIPAKEADRA